MYANKCSIPLGFLKRSSMYVSELRTWLNSEVAVAHMFLPVHVHVCSGSMEVSCFFMGPRWLIYPIVSWDKISVRRFNSFQKKSQICPDLLLAFFKKIG